MPSIQAFDPFLDKKAAKTSPAKLLKGGADTKSSAKFQQSFQGHLDLAQNPPNHFKKADAAGEKFKPLSRKAPEREAEPSRDSTRPVKSQPVKNQSDKRLKASGEKSARHADSSSESQDARGLDAQSQSLSASDQAAGTSNTQAAKAETSNLTQDPANTLEENVAQSALAEDSKAGVVFLSPFFFPNLAENSASLSLLEGNAEGSSAMQNFLGAKNGELSAARWSAEPLRSNFAWQTGKNAEDGAKLTGTLPEQTFEEAYKTWQDQRQQMIDSKTPDLLKAHGEVFDQNTQAKVLADNPALSEKTLGEKFAKLEQEGQTKADRINLANNEFEKKAILQKQFSQQGLGTYEGGVQAVSSNKKQPGLDAFGKGFSPESFKLYSEQTQRPSQPVLNPTNIQAFEENLVSLRTTGRENFVLDLKPEGLGRMDFRFIRNGKELKAEIAVQDSDLAENLKKEVKHLKASLEKHGFIVDDLKILVKEQPQNSANFGSPFAQQNPNSDFLGSFQQQQSGAFTKKQANPPLAQARVNDEVRLERASRIKDPSQLIDLEA